MLLSGGAVVGGHRVEGVIGIGGMGVVYEATQLSLNRRVALKALRPELARDEAFVARFRREGRVQASFHHPHAIEVFEAFEDEAGLFLAMRLERGPTLAELLAEGRLDGARALRLLGQVAEALDAAHAAGLVHRDVKPANVLVGDGDNAYLGDFGLTRAGDGTDLTATGGMLGSLSYLAPELIAGEPGTSASDKYALAAVALECLTGEVPFPRTSHAAVLYAHTHEPAPVPSARRPELGPAVDAALASGLDKAPGARPASAAALIAAIGPVDLGPPPLVVVATTEVAVPPLPRPGAPAGVASPARGRRPRVAVVAALLTGLVAGAGAMALADGGADAPQRLGGTLVRVPAPPAEAAPLGSALTRTGRTVDCRGRVPSAQSPPCTVAQAALPGRRSVIPEDGAILGWTVTGATGELALQVLRRRSGGSSQVARTQYEFANNAGPHHFDTNLDVTAGDAVALEVTRGSGFGLARTDGATTRRWFPTRRGKPELPPDAPPGSGVDGEVLVRADYVPGGSRVEPPSFTGADAARQPGGRRVAREDLTFTDGRDVSVQVVELDHAVALDLFRNARRVSRFVLPGMLPEGRVISFNVLNYEDSQAAGEVGVEWQNVNSARVTEHYFGVYPRALEFYD